MIPGPHKAAQPKTSALRILWKQRAGILVGWSCLLQATPFFQSLQQLQPTKIPALYFWRILIADVFSDWSNWGFWCGPCMKPAIHVRIRHAPRVPPTGWLQPTRSAASQPAGGLRGPVLFDLEWLTPSLGGPHTGQTGSLDWLARWGRGKRGDYRLRKREIHHAKK